MAVHGTILWVCTVVACTGYFGYHGLYIYSTPFDVPAQNDVSQSKYQHIRTNSRGRGNIINVDGECKLWNTEDRVVGGRQAEIGEMPCIALLEYSLLNQNVYSFDCVGSLINQRYVLTAAQCLVQKNKKLFNIRLGEYNLANDTDFDEAGTKLPSPLNVGIDKLIPHENYSPKTLVNDIGLIRLSMDVPYTIYYVQPICIPDMTMNTAVGDVARVSGWGTDGIGELSAILQSVWVQIKDPQQCNNIYEPISKLCAGGERDRNACVDDLGGPLLMRYNLRSYIEGIVSYSPGCPRNGIPDVYTRVSYFNAWIQQNLEP